MASHKTLNKADLQKIISDNIDISNEKVKKVSNIITKELKTILSEEKSVNIPGFGSFYTEERPPRKGYIPSLKKKALFPKHIAAHFEAAEEFRNPEESADEE